jgi:allantoinase
MAVYLGLNLEHFAFGEGLGAELAPGGPQPDVLNFTWRAYGNRVGVWRMLELFDNRALPASVLVNSSIYGYCP